MISYREQLKQFPVLVRLKRRLCSEAYDSIGSTRLNVLSTFPSYFLNSAGKYDDRARLTIQGINQLFPALSSLSETVRGKTLPIEDVTQIPRASHEIDAITALKERLDFYGSDKAHHRYHELYGTILCDRNSVGNILEIGLGTNNTDVISNMGASGKPGASLRAFRDLCPNAKIFGADIDKRVLFQEDRIETHFVDQTKPATLEQLRRILPDSFDLVIDDGLHSPSANVETLRFGINIIKQGGWVVIEDIVGEAVPIWQVVAALLPSKFRPHIFKAREAVMFGVQRLS